MYHWSLCLGMKRVKMLDTVQHQESCQSIRLSAVCCIMYPTISHKVCDVADKSVNTDMSLYNIIISRHCIPALTDTHRGRIVSRYCGSTDRWTEVMSSLDTLVQRHRRPDGSHQSCNDTDNYLVIHYLL